MPDHDLEKAAAAVNNETASPSGSDLPRHVEKNAERHLDDGTATHGSCRTSRDGGQDGEDDEDADTDEDEDDSEANAIPGRALDRQLSRVGGVLLHPGISASSGTLC